MIWTLAEPGIYLISACLMTLRPLLQRFGSGTFLATKNHDYATNTHKIPLNSIDAATRAFPAAYTRMGERDGGNSPPSEDQRGLVDDRTSAMEEGKITVSQTYQVDIGRTGKQEVYRGW
jgi:hypothetical protein